MKRKLQQVLFTLSIMRKELQEIKCLHKNMGKQIGKLGNSVQREIDVTLSLSKDRKVQIQRQRVVSNEGNDKENSSILGNVILNQQTNYKTHIQKHSFNRKNSEQLNNIDIKNIKENVLQQLREIKTMQKKSESLRRTN